MINAILVVLLVLIGGVPSILLTLSVPVMLVWKIYRKVRYGYSLYQKVKIDESKGTASEKGAVPFDFSKILTYVCDIIGAPKEMYCAINLAVKWRISI